MTRRRRWRGVPDVGVEVPASKRSRAPGARPARHAGAVAGAASHAGAVCRGRCSRRTRRRARRCRARGGGPEEVRGGARRWRAWSAASPVVRVAAVLARGEVARVAPWRCRRDRSSRAEPQRSPDEEARSCRTGALWSVRRCNKGDSAEWGAFYMSCAGMGNRQWSSKSRSTKRATAGTRLLPILTCEIP